MMITIKGMRNIGYKKRGVKTPLFRGVIGYSFFVGNKNSNCLLNSGNRSKLSFTNFSEYVVVGG
jgi:hypothetical protein